MKFATKNGARRSVSLPSPPLPSLAALVLVPAARHLIIGLLLFLLLLVLPQPNRSRL
jgi:hypothetical protein